MKSCHGSVGHLSNYWPIVQGIHWPLLDYNAEFWWCLCCYLKHLNRQWNDRWNETLRCPSNVTVIALTHWGRVTHICVGKLIIIGSDNGLSPDRRQAIIWTNVGLMSIGPLRTYYSENLIKIQQFSLKKLHVKMSSAKWRPSCLGLNVLTMINPYMPAQ